MNVRDIKSGLIKQAKKSQKLPSANVDPDSVKTGFPSLMAFAKPGHASDSTP